VTAQPSPDLPDSLRRDRKPAAASGEEEHGAFFARIGTDPDKWAAGFVGLFAGCSIVADSGSYPTQRTVDTLRLTGWFANAFEAGRAAPRHSAVAMDDDQPDLYREAAEAWLAVDPDGPTPTVLAGMRTLMAAVDRVAELVRAEAVQAIIDHANIHFPDPTNSAQRTARRWLHTAARIAAGPITHEQAVTALAAGQYIACNLDEAGRAVEPRDETGPHSGLSATQGACEASSVGAAGSEGQRGSESVSGGAA
jgi:hypothetical protein